MQLVVGLQHVVQQIHNKSKLVEFGLIAFINFASFLFGSVLSLPFYKLLFWYLPLISSNQGKSNP